MHQRIVVRGYNFTAAGDYGQIVVYDDRGQRLVEGLRNLPDAEAWCQRRFGARPEREVTPRPPPQIGRSRLTGY